MKKVLKFLLIATMLFALFTVSSFAAEKTVYVKSGASGTGTQDSPVATIALACDKLAGEGGTIVLLDEIKTSSITIPEQSGDLTITAEGNGVLNIAGTLYFSKNKNDNLITIDCPIKLESAQAMFGSYNSILFTENVTVDGALSFYGGVDSGKNATSGVGDRAVNDPANQYCIATRPYSITVKGGTFAKFFGGNRRSAANAIVGSIAAPITITIDGGTFGSAPSYTANSPIKTECLFSISGYSILADDATLTINGGTFLAPVYAQGHLGEMNTAASGGSQITKSDVKYYRCDGDINVNINGGTFNTFEISAFQNSSVYTMLLRGNYNLAISDNATLQGGMVLDATQVKAFAGSENKATLTYPESMNVTVKRFDTVNGKTVTYNEPLRIACIGDSITEGNSSGSRQTLSYPAQLLTKLHGEGKDVILGNYGCSGTRVENYNTQYYNDMLAYNLALESDADIFIIGLGTNDSGVIQGGKSQIVRFYNEYTELLKDFGSLATTDKVYATTATYRPSTLGYGAITVRAQQIKATEALAKTSDKYVLVDLYALTLEEALAGNFLSSDDLHPHADGYAIYVDVLCNAMDNGVCRLEGFESEHIYLKADGTTNMFATEQNPTNSLMIAFAKAAPNATLHVIGAYTAELYDANRNLSTPPVESFTIKGEGTGAKLTLSSKYFLAESDIVLDNITLTTSASNSIFIQLGYNNATLTESFKTEANHYACLLAGYVTYASNTASTYHTIEANIQADKDCVININGGNYAYINGGNYLYNSAAEVGTYSGDMVINVGGGIVMQDISYNTNGRFSGACGHNYLTGTVEFNVNAWHKNYPIREHTLLVRTHDYEKNTGSVTINKGANVTTAVLLTGDFDANGDIDIFDTLYALKALVNNSFDKSEYFYGRASVELVDILRLLKQSVK